MRGPGQLHSLCSRLHRWQRGRSSEHLTLACTQVTQPCVDRLVRGRLSSAEVIDENDVYLKRVRARKQDKFWCGAHVGSGSVHILGPRYMVRLSRAHTRAHTCAVTNFSFSTHKSNYIIFRVEVFLSRTYLPYFSQSRGSVLVAPDRTYLRTQPNGHRPWRETGQARNIVLPFMLRQEYIPRSFLLLHI